MHRPLLSAALLVPGQVALVSPADKTILLVLGVIVVALLCAGRNNK